ncbi:beta-lactamase family protein [Flavobacterium sp. ANB]|uniref:serine hydrolase domain-containing protein n=1 Tax=unclassified Flavobacterium TaxID=196869 RepID=UPI0012B85203|nr:MULTISPECIES: serine hydrolase domain-containing protein [unclassified Flavobacterium]MBF4518576.1 beta-lactamase family protein [Flavobacterium sp. ANB]MTD67918.1 serine hydrolase [Flavobacterium sp. LC2016-13]
MRKKLNKIVLLLAIFMITNGIYSQGDKVDNVVREMIQKNNIIGLQLAVVKDNKIVKELNYGLSNIQDSVLVDNETVFNINAITKAFTGVALMQLVENRKLNLEEPISKYLDDLPNTWQSITIKELATHTSGLPDIWTSEENLLTQNNITSLNKIKELPVVFEPGERFDYNQTNYLLLVMIIEKVSGKSFDKYLIENEFEKAEMKNSIKAGFADYYNVFKRRRSSYKNARNGDVIDVYEIIPENLRTSAGIYSTAKEIAQWIIALQNHQLIKEEKNLETLLTSMILKNEVIASLGVSSGMYIYPKDNLSVIILTNAQGFRPEGYLENIASLFIEKN